MHMRYSRLFGKTSRDAKADMKLASHKLLYQGGFVRELSAGRYEFLPLGFLVWQKIVNLVDEEMESIGSQRMSIPLLQPMEYWQKTNRDKVWGSSLMKITDARGAEFALSATGEGIVTEMVSAQSPTYKDLPIILHQTIEKFRDEIRVRGGILRAREFTMKDAYSYHETEEDFMKTYQDFYDAYSRVCGRLDLPFYAVEADNGALGGDYSHEFQIPCEDGEDMIAVCKSCDYSSNIEKAQFEREKINEDEEVKEMIFVDQKWEEARTIPQMAAFYGRPENNMIKSVAFKRLDGRLVIAVVTGNLDVNDLKLARAVNETELEKATEQDLEKIGVTSGALHAWGYEEFVDTVTFVVDHSVVTAKNLYGGFKLESTDPTNVNYGRDFKHEIEADIAQPYKGARCVTCGDALDLIRAIEFGHIFKYDHFYTSHHDGYFIDKDGTKKLMYMGAYGIGIGRAMALVVQLHHDDKGIIWPKSIAPYTVHLVGLQADVPEVRSYAESVYEQLKKHGIEVLFDDRLDVSAGQKFADADLIGIPYRVVVSKKTGDQVEVKSRDSSDVEMLEVGELVEKIRAVISN
ncbi:proline--tRNA ligase [candidate division WWE3 bacterium CG_4_10_14_0_2_um_filter_41_14]|uniref:Proline--tRNA ligase n=1 Tax=candidate division WWE3 bacterium CG_4_10_14_0_2_um_filter_41_14 TaxID=1975072 RepID=A0A2M7TK24_UNCKA|nr:MAG: proline--tRNA ligase [candidate division WWE3 bacterium CG_4_10_14_0_2_um_filter_41_14]